MNQLNKLYEEMLKSWNCVIQPDYRLSLLMGGVETPIRVDDKDVYLGTNEVLNGITIGKVIFHPACESIMSKETEIFKVIRKLTAARLYQVVQPIAQVIFAVAGKKTGKSLPSKLVEALAPFKHASKEVRDDVLDLIKGIGIVLDADGIDNRLITFTMTKGGKDHNDNHIYYTATPAYPYYNELAKFLGQNPNKKPGDKVVFNKIKVHYEALLLVASLFELVFPSVTDPSQHSYSVTTADCARLISYLQSYALVASELNAFIGKFRKEFDAIGIYGVGLTWLAELENLPELKSLIPVMEYNNHNTAVETSRSAMNAMSDPYSSLMNTQRTVHDNAPVTAQPANGGKAPAPNPRPGEQFIGVDYLPNNGLYEFRYNQPGGMIRVATCTDDGCVMSETYTTPQALALKAAGHQPGGMAPLGQGGMMDPRVLLMMTAMGQNPNGFNMGNGYVPTIGMVPPGFYRDTHTGQLMPLHNNQGAPLGQNDSWGNTPSVPAGSPMYNGGWSNM